MKKEFTFAATLIIVIAGKLTYEQLVGSLPGTSDMSGGPVVVDAHLYGAIGGIVAFLLLEFIEMMAQKYFTIPAKTR